MKRKVEANGVPLSEWGVEINYGIKTGNNDVFIIDGDKRNEILNNCITEEERIRTAEIIRPILRGRDIEQYKSNFADKWIIATFPSKKYDIDDYPSLKNYLLSFGVERLEQSGKTHVVNGEKIKARKKTGNKWFETQDSISYWDNFSRPKIVYPNMTKFFPFYLDNEGFYTNQKCFVITGEKLEYLTAFFNSSLFRLCFKENFPGLQGESRELSKVYFEQIPIMVIDEITNEWFVEKVQQIQDLRKRGISSKDLEGLVDEAICRLYHFSDNELDLILQG